MSNQDVNHHSSRYTRIVGITLIMMPNEATTLSIVAENNDTRKQYKYTICMNKAKTLKKYCIGVLSGEYILEFACDNRFPNCIISSVSLMADSNTDAITDAATDVSVLLVNAKWLGNNYYFSGVNYSAHKKRRDWRDIIRNNHTTHYSNAICS